ncbi:MAG: PEP-CTERM sorting domain-containing protein [Nitrospirota bacterium]|nr:PEP-CTERM sorting domain-containing protein [Nitrospirota bacterium]
MKISNRLLLTILFAFMLLYNGNAYAIPCDSGGVSGSVKCQDGLKKNDLLSDPLTVNTESFFGFTDWIWLEKYDADNGGLETNFDFDWTVIPEDNEWPNDKGTWSFSGSVWDIYEDVMILVKGGNNEKIYFSGYLLDNSTKPTSGTWDVGNKELSHLTLYARGNTPVPEPGTIMLLGSGLVGVAALGRKRFKK